MYNKNTMKNTINTRKKILGVNDDRDFCCCCGKEGLKRVVWIEDMETGEIRHFGTTCATKNSPALFGEIKDAIRSHDKELTEKARTELRARQKARTDKFLARKNELYEKRGGVYITKEIGPAKILGTIPADSELMQECWEIANAEIPPVKAA